MQLHLQMAKLVWHRKSNRRRPARLNSKPNSNSTPRHRAKIHTPLHVPSAKSHICIQQSPTGHRTRGSEPVDITKTPRAETGRGVVGLDRNHKPSRPAFRLPQPARPTGLPAASSMDRRCQATSQRPHHQHRPTYPTRRI
jgi:hypothetical protein